MIRFLSFANPLKWWDSALVPEQQTNNPRADYILYSLITPYTNLAGIVARYKEIDAVPDPLLIVPAEEAIFEKLVWPLRHAKNSYALRNYVGCIALCGMVGEMVAILLWEISSNGQSMTPSQQRSMFGNTFERLGQTRRINVLYALKLVDDATKAAFERLSQIRNKYLHFLSQSHAQVDQDSLRAYENALQIVAVVLGQTFTDGDVVLRPDLEAYLFDKGIISRPESDTT